MTEGPFEHVVDCGAGTAVDRDLEAAERGLVHELGETAHRQQQAAEARDQALQRLIFRSLGDAGLRDLLIVLGLAP